MGFCSSYFAFPFHLLFILFTVLSGKVFPTLIQRKLKHGIPDNEGIPPVSLSLEYSVTTLFDIFFIHLN